MFFSFYCSTVVGEAGKSSSLLSILGHFFTMFLGSALIGIIFALISALVSFPFLHKTYLHFCIHILIYNYNYLAISLSVTNIYYQTIFLTFPQLLKHVHLRRHPSLELSLILIFSYAPYGLAEGLKLSGFINTL